LTVGEDGVYDRSRVKQSGEGFEEGVDNGCDKSDKVVVVEKSRKIELLQTVAALSQKSPCNFIIIPALAFPPSARLASSALLSMVYDIELKPGSILSTKHTIATLTLVPYVSACCGLIRIETCKHSWRITRDRSQQHETHSHLCPSILRVSASYKSKHPTYIVIILV
jgi:hypothetical protein